MTLMSMNLLLWEARCNHGKGGHSALYLGQYGSLNLFLQLVIMLMLNIIFSIKSPMDCDKD